MAVRLLYTRRGHVIILTGNDASRDINHHIFTVICLSSCSIIVQKLTIIIISLSHLRQKPVYSILPVLTITWIIFLPLLHPPCFPFGSTMSDFTLLESLSSEFVSFSKVYYQERGRGTWDTWPINNLKYFKTHSSICGREKERELFMRESFYFHF